MAGDDMVSGVEIDDYPEEPDRSSRTGSPDESEDAEKRSKTPTRNSGGNTGVGKKNDVGEKLFYGTLYAAGFSHKVILSLWNRRADRNRTTSSPPLL